MSEKKSPAIDPATVAPHVGTGYPPPYKAGVDARERRALGDVFGLANFGVNLTRLPPGCASAQRHWHKLQDEFIYIVEGTPILETSAGEQELRPGMVAGFPAGVADGHRLINRTARDVIYLEIGDRAPGDEVDYPDVDMIGRDIGGKWKFTRRDGGEF